MKEQSTETMVTHIRAILEQNQNPSDLVGRDDVRTLSIEAMIANFLEEAVSMAVDNADEMLFQKIDTKTESPTSGVFTLDTDCQRLLQISSSSWNGVVKDLIEKSSPIYRMCQNSYFQAVGVKDRPVAFKDFSSSNRAITIYPAVSSVTLSYIKKAKIGTGTSGTLSGKPVIPCDDMIYEGACFYCAYLVAMVQGWASASTYRQEAIEALKVVNADSVKAAAAKLA